MLWYSNGTDNNTDVTERLVAATVTTTCRVVLISATLTRHTVAKVHLLHALRTNTHIQQPSAPTGSNGQTYLVGYLPMTKSIKFE